MRQTMQTAAAAQADPDRAGRGGAGRGGARPGRGAAVPGAGPVPPHPRAVELLGRADSLLARAACVAGAEPAESFRLAYVAAARGAAAVLAAGPARRPARGASRSVWSQLAAAGAGWQGWAEYFAQHSATRQAVEAGVSGRVGPAEASALVAAVHDFLDAVEDSAVGGAVPAASHPLSRAS